MYAALEDSVRAWADGAGIDFDARVQAAQERYARAGQELTQEQAAEEVVGDMLGTIFADPSAAQELLNNAPRSVLEKGRIIDYRKNWKERGGNQKFFPWRYG